MATNLKENYIERAKFLQVDDVAEILQVSKPHAYRIMRELNNELKDIGKITIAGKVSKKYFEEKMYA